VSDPRSSARLRSGRLGSVRLRAYRVAGAVDAVHVTAFVLRAVLAGRGRSERAVAARGDALVAVVGLALAVAAGRLLRRDLADGRAPRPAVRRLLVAGLLVNTVGTTLLAAPRSSTGPSTATRSSTGRARRSPTSRAATGYLLVGGDLVSVAYLLAARPTP